MDILEDYARRKRNERRRVLDAKRKQEKREQREKLKDALTSVHDWRMKKGGGYHSNAQGM